MSNGNTPEKFSLSLRRRKLLAVSGVSIAGIAGCGESDDEIQQPQETESAENGEADEEEEEEEEEGGSASFEITNIDHPDEVDTGEEHDITVTIENTGDAAGNYEELLEISSGGVDEWDNVDNYVGEDIEPGETDTLSLEDISFGNPGTVQFRLGDTQWEYDITITEPDEQSFSGSGQSVESGIDIDGGLVVVEASHDGERNFQVSLEDDTEYGESFINIIGAFDGAQAELVDEGEYLLDVNADGNWDITIRQPRTGQGDELPTTIAGSGPEVSNPIRFSGTGVATGEHDGERNFQVRIYPMTGSFGESVFNEIGEFDGETTYSFDGIGWVDINADGNWSVELE